MLSASCELSKFLYIILVDMAEHMPTVVYFFQGRQQQQCHVNEEVNISIRGGQVTPKSSMFHLIGIKIIKKKSSILQFYHVKSFNVFLFLIYYWSSLSTSPAPLSVMTTNLLRISHLVDKLSKEDILGLNEEEC